MVCVGVYCVRYRLFSDSASLWQKGLVLSGGLLKLVNGFCPNVARVLLSFISPHKHKPWGFFIVVGVLNEALYNGVFLTVWRLGRKRHFL